MMPPVIALTGLSGVGKSTLLGRLNGIIPMQVLQAGALIKEARTLTDSEAVTLDGLRSVDLDENQRLLVQGFESQVDLSSPLVVLDCHTVIETPKGLVLIDPHVFGLMNAVGFIFLEDTPAEILCRRQTDVSRQRPAATAAELEAVQIEALRHTNSIAAALNVPLHVHRPSGEDSIIAGRLRSFQGVGR